ncbi:universal stress protein [Actinokineospora sp. PR83]|uniref:universal stress protein n=1 Tax=Actinokineospora sp. PR83 TaxID=2884908 RepID=UPI001F210D49|nr:universal stress protein [Actinokineospora sp. PR83]MCG8917481.1 universal stress protein [Actinokineospora sp. PR83]
MGVTGYVVGLDTTRAGAAALAWAMTEAERTHRPVRAVTVWRSGPPFPWAEGVLRTLEAAAAAHPHVDLAHRELTGPTAAALVRAAREAELIVLGRDGGAGFVAAHCARDARCPVVD